MTKHEVGSYEWAEANPNRYGIWVDSWLDWQLFRGYEAIGEYKTLIEAVDAAYDDAKTRALKEPS